MNVNFNLSFKSQDNLNIQFFGSIPLAEDVIFAELSDILDVGNQVEDKNKNLHILFVGLSEIKQTETVPTDEPHYHVFKSMQAFKESGAKDIAEKIETALENRKESAQEPS